MRAITVRPAITVRSAWLNHLCGRRGREPERGEGKTDLFNQAFSLEDPKPGAPRLRLAANDGSKTYDNRHRGARAFADGLYTDIRNPGMHTPPPNDGGEEQLALEQLAAFSLLARWVDQVKVESD